jgi:hypothetical protein
MVVGGMQSTEDIKDAFEAAMEICPYLATTLEALDKNPESMPTHAKDNNFMEALLLFVKKLSESEHIAEEFKEKFVSLIQAFEQGMTQEGVDKK